MPDPWASLAAFYLDDSLSDCNIVFVPKQQVQGSGSGTGTNKGKKRKHSGEGEQLPVLETMPGHRIVLAACSPYFQALFVRWKQGSDQQVTVEYDGPDDLAAAKACIKTLYLQTPPSNEDLSTDAGSVFPLLLKMIDWADLWQAPTCTELCISSLVAQRLDSLCPEHINSMLVQLPESLRSTPLNSKVEGFCLRWLLYTFGDMWVTVTTEAKRAAFCNLCPAAVELWMGSDQLAGVENEVAVLVTLWHAGQQGQAASDASLRHLSELLRVKNLAPSTRVDPLLGLPWFQHNAALKKLIVLAGSGWCLAEVASEDQIEFPPAWFAEPRCGTLRSVSPPLASRCQHVWRISTADFAALINKAKTTTRYQELASSTIFCKGAFFKGALVLRHGNEEGELYLGLSFRTAGDSAYPRPIIQRVKYSMGFEEQGERVTLAKQAAFFDQEGWIEYAKSFAAELIDWEEGVQQPADGFFTFFFIVHMVE
uniref:BTB domain-containing protein n=1 Tax=Dunaliella tertiolecta TaxID=3047 RepID=A0A7S3R8P5_DUNTE|eukprot:CAMPEP_0202384104 /NCGR_PEP_ID=MMETSP1127-20130417/53265_1 /ASSEMBLY_ACC=CAM_ASM_000462 /TAXON_ID=3047 /ORGANISM="Dunaliella tertiolecta, Strain CCMP1320" /LENGTH=480 /DNA_ID=CAMNT_0048983799 /DNA_START=69 /DNA_END=1511 /DNA_ORIENTATION=-